KDSYVHRIGRTGRAGHEGRAISIVTRDDLMDLYAIEEHIGVLIEECELPGDEFLSEHKQEIDEWIAANTIKKTDSRKTGEKSETGSQGRRDRNRPDRRKKPDTRPGTQRNAPEGTAVKDDAGRQYKNTGKQTREDNGKQRQNSGKQKPHSKTEKPLRQETKPGGQDTGPMRQDAKPLRRSAGNQPVRGLPEAASPQKPDGNIRTPGGETRKSGGKPGFIRRILGRILGR
ncbi:MAG TPA: DEAD/DEAH box helicase, partial [Clostridia bacterium]